MSMIAAIVLLALSENPSDQELDRPLGGVCGFNIESKNKFPDEVKKAILLEGKRIMETNGGLPVTITLRDLRKSTVRLQKSLEQLRVSELVVIVTHRREGKSIAIIFTVQKRPLLV